MKRIITILICLLPLIALEQSPFTCGNLTVKGTEKITNIPYVSLPSDTGDYNVLFWNKTTDKVYRGSILGTTGPTGPTGIQGVTGATGSGGSGFDTSICIEHFNIDTLQNRCGNNIITKSGINDTIGFYNAYCNSIKPTWLRRW